MTGMMWGRTPSGKAAKVQVTEEGAVVVSGAVGGGGSGGTSDTLESTQKDVRTAVQNIDVDLGAAADAPAGSDTGASSIVSLLKRGLQRWTMLLERIPALVSGRIPVDGSGVTQPVSAVARACLGRQTIPLAAAGTASLTVPDNAVAAHIQADGATIRIRLDGQAPTATVGTRLDDGVIYPVDSTLAGVRLYGVGACNVQVVYFDRA